MHQEDSMASRNVRTDHFIETICIETERLWLQDEETGLNAWPYYDMGVPSYEMFLLAKDG